MSKSRTAERSAETTPMPASHLATTDGSQLPAEPFLTEDMFAEDANAGHENVTSDDIIVPRISILQALSPQLKKGKPEFIEGAQVGDICDVGMNEIMPEPLWFLPCYYSKAWIEWAPRSAAQSLVAIHKTPDILSKTTLNDRKQSILPNGNLIAETAQFYGLNLSAGGRPSFLPMASTQLKRARRWLNLTTSEKGRLADGRQFDRPIYYRSYKLYTMEETNPMGDWIGWDIRRDIPVLDMGADARAVRDAARKLCHDLRRSDLAGNTLAQMDEADHSAAQQHAA